MKNYRADIHIHSVASPCGDLEMSPSRIAQAARSAGLDIIAITDHNTTAHCRLIHELGTREGLLVVPGVEVTTSEEIHCLCYFRRLEDSDHFDSLLKASLPDITNNPDKFGYQVIVNEKEEILDYITPLLLSATRMNLTQLSQQVRLLNGILVPAHVDRPSYSILSQLGFFPIGFQPEAIEVTAPLQAKSNPLIPQNLPWISSSDAHYLHLIGSKTTTFSMPDLSLESFFNTLTSNTFLTIFPGL